MRTVVAVVVLILALAVGGSSASAGSGCHVPKGGKLIKQNSKVVIYERGESGDVVACARPTGRSHFLAQNWYLDAGFGEILRLKISGHSVFVKFSEYNMDITEDPYTDKFRIDLRSGKRTKIYHKLHHCEGDCFWEYETYVNGKGWVETN